MAYFPTKEGELNTYFLTGTTYVLANSARLKVSADNVITVTAKRDLWVTRYPLAINPATSTTTNVGEKNVTKGEFKTIFRLIFGDIPNSVLTPTDRDTLNIPERDGANGQIPMTDSNPIGSVDAGARLRHTLHIVDSVSGKKAQPRGVSACEVWQKIGGTPPLVESELVYIGSTASDSFTTNFSGDDGGKLIYYWLRWVNSRNDKGSWGPGFSGNVQS